MSSEGRTLSTRVPMMSDMNQMQAFDHVVRPEMLPADAAGEGGQ